MNSNFFFLVEIKAHHIPCTQVKTLNLIKILTFTITNSKLSVLILPFTCLNDKIKPQQCAKIKTRLIEQLLEQWGKVNLFTRPRCFGKTLNMSMLRYFFEIGTDQTLFDNLYISQNQTLCETYMGKFPVIFISLKNVDGLTFEDAQYQLAELIGMEAERFYFLSSSDRLSENEKERYHALISLSNGRYAMDNQVLTSSLQILSQLLCKYYGQRVIVLIDEYDVPLDKAFQHGYYKEMVSLIRGLFGKVLKTNV